MDVIFEDSGASPGKPVLVLLHPFGGSLRFWEEACRGLMGRFRVVAYDRAGSGRTPPPERPQSMAESVAELEGLRGRLGLDRIVVAGVAIGAMIGAAYAASHPGNVAALILCNPALKVSEAGRAMTLERVRKLRAGGIEALLPDAVDRAFNGMPKAEAYARYLREFRANDAHGYEMSALATLGLDISVEARRVNSPTLVLAGEHDILFPPSNAAEVASMIPNATLEILRDAAHFPPIQNPAAFVAAVDRFVGFKLDTVS